MPCAYEVSKLLFNLGVTERWYRSLSFITVLSISETSSNMKVWRAGVHTESTRPPLVE